MYTYVKGSQKNIYSPNKAVPRVFDMRMLNTDRPGIQ